VRENALFETASSRSTLFDREAWTQLILQSSSSVVTKFPVPTRTVYAISKAALESLTQQWAAELPKQYNCTVNAVRVGATVTETSAASAQAGDDPARDKARAKVIEQTTAAARLGQVDDIAQVVAWLASEGSRWVNGQTLNANGGVAFT
jgi:3-oxoacyl-[acyl-carrier protein] reductase